MRVAFVAYEYPPYSFGGIGSFSEDLSLGLSSAGIRVVVLSLSHSKRIAKEVVNPNLKIIRVPTFNFPPRHLWWQAGNFNLILNLLTKLKPDLVHSNSLVASLPLQAYRKVSKVPQVFTIHGYNKKILKILLSNNTGLLQPKDFFQHVLLAPLYDMLLQAEMKTADCAVAVAKHLENDLLKRFKMVNITSIYNGIAIEPSSDEHPADVKSRENSSFPLEKRSTKVAYVGRLFWLKGITYALNGFSALMRLYHPENIELNIYGDGPLRGVVQKFIKSKESTGAAHYFGQLPRDRILTELRNSDIVIFPSVYEACPIALLEALSLGKAVIVNRATWSEEFIEDRVNGMRVNTRDPKAFADCLFELTNNRKLREKISRNATKGIDKYSISNVTKMYARVYDKLV